MTSSSGFHTSLNKKDRLRVAPPHTLAASIFCSNKKCLFVLRVKSRFIDLLLFAVAAVVLSVVLSAVGVEVVAVVAVVPVALSLLWRWPPSVL